MPPAVVAEGDGGGRPRRRYAQTPPSAMKAGTRAFLDRADQSTPTIAQTLLVEIIGAGPRAAHRRDLIMQQFADDARRRERRRRAARGLIGRFASPLDAYAIVGAITELVSRQVRLGEPADVLELAPVIDRLIGGCCASDAPLVSERAERSPPAP